MKQPFVIVVTRLLIFIFLVGFISRQLALDILKQAAMAKQAQVFIFAPSVLDRNISRVECMFVYVWERESGNSK